MDHERGWENGSLSYVRASDVYIDHVDWLWEGRIPMGAITLLDGDPGLGKSLITLDLAARVTTSREMPDGTDCGTWGNVLLFSAEDDPSTTIVPRLRIANADLSKVTIARGTNRYDAEMGRKVEQPFTLPLHIPELEETIERDGTLLVVIDPLMAYLEAGVNSWRDQDVRKALAPLAEMAARTFAAVLILRHLNKSTGTSALYRGGGSIGIIGAARSGLLVAKSPDDPDHERVLAASKSNLGPPMPSLRYRVTASESPNNGEIIPWVEWLGESSLGASALLAAPQTVPEEPSPSKVQQALEWLYAALAAAPRLALDTEQEALAAGIRGATLRRAREQLGVRIERLGFGPEMRVWWVLEDQARGEDMPAPVSAPSADGDAPVTPVAPVAPVTPVTPVLFNMPSPAHPQKMNTTDADEHH